MKAWKLMLAAALLIALTASAVAETDVRYLDVSGSEKTVKGLELNSAYVAQVTAFGAEGNMSPPSEPLAFETNSSGLPLTLRLR